MKKLFLGALLALAAPAAHAQFQTPGTGVRWTLAQLAAAPGSNVVLSSPGVYAVNGSLRLSATDTLTINTNATLRLAALAQVNVDGVLLVNPRDSVKITAQLSSAPFHSLAFSATSQGSRLRKTIVEYGGGIRILDNDLVLDSCVVRYQVARIGTVNTNSGAISPSGGAPRILNCRIYENARSGVQSPANRNTSPFIQNCVFRDNGTENGNYPQINLGIGGVLPIVIERCLIVGRYPMAGGVAVSNLLGTAGVSQVRIRQNRIANNRYGITLLGAGITAVISRNVIENNSINPNAMTGGSGINLQGGATLTGVASRNVLRGNLWGVTVLRTSSTSTAPGPTISFGDASSTDSLNVGRNLLYDNANGGQVYDFYLNMPDNMLAQNNDWGTNSAAVVESHVVHQVDQPALGLLNFLPLRATVLGTRPAASPLAFSTYPNPALSVLTLRLPTGAPAAVRLRDALGRLAYAAELASANGQLAVPVAGLAPGLYALEVTQQGQTATAKVQVGE